MSILINNSIQNSFVEPYNPTRVKGACYELSLGNEVFTTNDESNTKKIYNEGEQISIEPGQFAILITKEIVELPDTILAFISIKFKIKFQGLVNISGFHVDPGFKGRLIFSVFNAGSRPIPLTIGAPTFLIWFNQLSNSVDKYNGVHNDQYSISDDAVRTIQGDVPSPIVLKNRIDALEHRIEVNARYLAAIAASCIILIFSTSSKSCNEFACSSLQSITNPSPQKTIPNSIIDTTNLK